MRDKFPEQPIPIFTLIMLVSVHFEKKIFLELNYRSVVLPKAFTGLNQAAWNGGEANFPARSVEARHCFSKSVMIGEKRFCSGSKLFKIILFLEPIV